MRRLGMHGFWAPARFKVRECEGREVPSWSGMALLTRRPWSLVDTLELPADPRDGDRIAQFGLIEDEQRRIVFANLHLTHLRDRDDLRREQLERVLEHPLMRIPGAIRMLCGDFNTTLNGPVIRSVLSSVTPGTLLDGYLLGGGGIERATLPPRAGMTEGRCVDHILSVAESASEHPVFTSSAVVLNRPEPKTGILPSDHFGVATTMVPLRSGSWRHREEQRLVS